MALDFLFATLMPQKMYRFLEKKYYVSIMFQESYTKPSYYINARANESLVQICKNSEII